MSKSIIKGYQHRGANSVTVPLEEDSDSDFNPGVYVPETEKKRKNGHIHVEGGSRKKRKVSDVLKDLKIKPGLSYSKGKKKRWTNTVEPNPLLKYFGEDMGLESASEDGISETDKSEEYQSDSDSEYSGPPVVMSKANISYLKPSEGFHPPTQKGSATESESDPDFIVEPASHPRINLQNTVFSSSLQTNTTKAISNITSGRAAQVSVTETESDPGFYLPVKEDSVTESESDPEFYTPTFRSQEKDMGSPLKQSDQGKAPSTKRQATYRSQARDLSIHPEPSFSPAELFPKPYLPEIPTNHSRGPLILDKDTGIEVPATISPYLRDYQRKGIEFLYKLYKEGRGGILGDDMGLGKTIQVISFLSAIMKKTGYITDENRRRIHVAKLQENAQEESGEALNIEKGWRKMLPLANTTWPTCLIICPSVLIDNWAREFEKWGYFEVGIYRAPDGRKDVPEIVLKDFTYGRLDIVIMSLTMATREIDRIDNLPWSLVIVDEAHTFKNESSKLNQALHQFNCPRRFALTGTLIQNDYKEMWTILDWTNPGKLGTMKQWKGYVAKPLINGQSSSSTEEQQAKALQVAQILKDKLLPDFFLRRTKDIIKDQLPTKTDEVVFCPLTMQQIEAYKNILKMEEVQNLLKRNEPCSCGSRKKRKDCCHGFVVGDVFRFLTILVKISNHLGLILPHSNSDDKEEYDLKVAKQAFSGRVIPKFGDLKIYPDCCGKWRALDALLTEWRKDLTNKVLVFTKSTRLIAILKDALDLNNYKYVTLEGKIKGEKRMPIIDQFNNDPNIFIFLISTLTGGTGLNLTSANKVVVFDPNWNPAHDLQAMDRAFRIGQTRDVSVYRLVGSGSVEELIYERQIYKQQQMAIGYDASVQTRYFEGIQGDNSNKGELFGLENIFTFREGSTATVIGKANLSQLGWALANMDPGGLRKKGKSQDSTLDKVRGKEEDILGNPRVLEELLLGNGKALLNKVKEKKRHETEQDLLKKSLVERGVTYTHRNDEVLAPNKIEQERTRQIIQKTREKSGRQQGTSLKQKRLAKKEKEKNPDEPVWPPVRKHHIRKQATNVQQQQQHQQHMPSTSSIPETLRQPLRLKALMQIGYNIDTPEDFQKFCQRFATEMSPDEQVEMVRGLDEFVVENALQLDSSSSSSAEP